MQVEEHGMSVSLTGAVEAESARAAESEQRASLRANPPMSGAALIAECASALRAAVALRPGIKLSESERDSLVQTLACEALSAHRRYHGSAPMTRASVGRTYLRESALGLLRQDRGWRDTLDGYRTRAERSHDLAPLFAGSVESVAPAAADDDAPADRGSGWLAVALNRERDRDPESDHVMPADLPALAGAVAVALTEALAVTGREAVAVTVAVRSACGEPLTEQAAEPGAASLRTLATRCGEGNALIAAGMSARDVATLTRAVADVELAERALMRRLRTALPVELESALTAAAAAVGATAATLRKQPRGPLPGPRSRVLNMRHPVRPVYGCATGPVPQSRPVAGNLAPDRRNAPHTSGLPAPVACMGNPAPACDTCGKVHPNRDQAHVEYVMGDSGEVYVGGPLHPTRSDV
jgi:hypothetical protein